MGSYVINHSNGANFDLFDLEQNGPNNQSTPREIQATSLSGGAGFNFFTLLDDLTYRFTVGFQFTVTASGGNDGVYTTTNSSFDGTYTTIFVAEVIPSGGLPFGNILYSLPVTENATSLLLSGRGTLNFGQSIMQNYVYLLENFANETSPDNPIIGQLWYKPSTNELFKYDGTIWNASLSFTSGGLSFVDPQHPFNSTTPVIDMAADDNDVGLSIKMTANPNGNDSIFRVLSANDDVRLRVEHNGFLSTTNSIKTTGILALNEFDNSIQFANNKGISSLQGSLLQTDVNGDVWEITPNNNTSDVFIVRDFANSPILTVGNDHVNMFGSMVIDPTNNILHVDYTSQNVGIGKIPTSGKLDVDGNIAYSGQSLGSDGTVLAPAISFLSNPSVGMRLIGAADIGLSSGGSDRFLINASGLASVTALNYETLVVSDNDIPNKKYVDTAVGAGVSALNDLIDVNITTPIDNNILGYDNLSGEWVNQTPDQLNLLSKDGGTMNLNANIFMNGGEIRGLPNVPTVDDAAASKKYVDDTASSISPTKLYFYGYGN